MCAELHKAAVAGGHVHAAALEENSDLLWKRHALCFSVTSLLTWRLVCAELHETAVAGRHVHAAAVAGADAQHEGAEHADEQQGRIV